MKENSHENQFLKERGIISDTIEEITDLYQQYSDLSDTIRENVISCLKKVLQATPEHKITVSHPESELYGSLPTITYDGGNHPEYASNAYSEVTAISLREERNTDEDKIVIDCEDAPGVGLNRIYSLNELYEILIFAEWFVFRREIGEEEEN